MEDFKDLYILGEPIPTRIGKLHFAKVCEYGELIEYIPYLNLQKFQVVNKIKQIDKELANLFKDLDLFQILKYTVEMKPLKEFYIKLFKFCFKEDVFDAIKDNDEFEYFRDLIRKINFVPYYVPNQNPEIERFNQMKSALAKKRNDATSFESLYTSVWVSLGAEPKNITIYQLHSLFNRIGLFKNYDTTSMYSMMSNEVKVESWYKHVDTIVDENKKEEKLGDVIEDINNKLGIKSTNTI